MATTAIKRNLAPTYQANPSWFTKTKLFTIEILVKEFFAICKYVYYSIRYFCDPHQYNLDRPTPLQKQSAKIILLVHGQGAAPATFLPLAQKLQAVGLAVYTVKYESTEDNPLPTAVLIERIKELAKEHPFEEVELIGHSLGGSMAARLAFMENQGGLNDLGIKISKVISIAGRLLFIPDAWSWYCPKLEGELKILMQDYARNNEQAELFTISGVKDALIPTRSVHIGLQKNQQYMAPNRRHFETVFATEVHTQVLMQTLRWGSIAALTKAQ